MRSFLCCLAIMFTCTNALFAADWPTVQVVDRQPLVAQVTRLEQALKHLGAPLSADALAELNEAKALAADQAVAARVQQILDPLCLAAVVLDAHHSPVVISRNLAVPLEEQGWRTFLIKVVNPAESRARLRIDSPNGRPLAHSPAEEVTSRWLGLSMFDGQPLTPALTGLPLEYRIVEVFSRDVGERKARMEFSAPVAGSSAGVRNSSIIADWRFDHDLAGWKAENQVELQVNDGALRLRGTGIDPFMTTTLPEPARPGNYVLRFWAKAEESGFGQIFWWTQERPQPDGGHLVTFSVEAGRQMLYEIPFSDEGHLTGIRIDPNGKPCRWQIDWIELANAEGGKGWGGTDISFQTRPSNLVTFRVSDDPDRPAMAAFEITDETGRVYPPQNKRLAPDFFFQRQIYRGDGETLRLPAGKYTVKCSRGPESIPATIPLVVGAGPAEVHYRVARWIDPSRRGYWSGDHHIHAAGCAHYESPTQGVHPPDMLRHCMGEDIKVGCCLTWGPCFDFQKRFFTGQLDGNSRYPYPGGLPTFNVPAFDGIGANEFIMNVAHTVEGPDHQQVPAVDFISTMNSDRTAEFNMWYHVLNCGFRVRASGETDFPCMSGERVGLGRVYVRLPGKLDFDAWCDALAAGRSYVSDGRTHLMEFSASTSTPEQMLEAGTNGSELKLSRPETVKFQVKVAGRYGDAHKLPVELIINGYPVAKQEVDSDGTERTLTFEHAIEKSSWAAIRVFPSGHTNPVFVIVDEKPIRASRSSAQWCLQSVEQCWKAKVNSYRADERETAAADYETARSTFRKIIAESR